VRRLQPAEFEGQGRVPSVQTEGIILIVGSKLLLSSLLPSGRILGEGRIRNIRRGGRRWCSHQSISLERQQSFQTLNPVRGHVVHLTSDRFQQNLYGPPTGPMHAKHECQHESKCHTNCLTERGCWLFIGYYVTSDVDVYHITKELGHWLCNSSVIGRYTYIVVSRLKSI
jgi:hypothetical protein